MRRLLIPLLLLALLLTACAVKPALPQQPESSAPEQNDAAEDGAQETPEQPEEQEDPATPDTPEEPEEVPPVYADWSQLQGAGTQQAQYRLWQDPLPAELIPGEDYGTLIPYAGQELFVDPGFGGWSSYRYGLSTLDGCLVTDAVYTDIYQPNYYTGLDTRTLPVYILTSNAGTVDADDANKSAVCALDGSWCTELCYTEIFLIDADRLLLVDETAHTWFCDLDGKVTRTPLEPSMTELYGEYWMWMSSLVSDKFCAAAADGSGQQLVNFSTGEIIPLPEVSFTLPWYSGDDCCVAATADNRYGYLKADGSWLIAPQVYYAGEFHGDYATVQRSQDGVWEWIDRSGSTIKTAALRVNTLSVGGEVLYLELDADGRIAGVWDAQLQPLDVPAVGQLAADAWTYLQWVDEDGVYHIWRDGQDCAAPEAGFSFTDCVGDYAVLWHSTEYTYGLYDFSADAWRIEPREGYLSLLKSADGMLFFVYGTDSRNYNITNFYGSDGQYRFSASVYRSPIEGLLPIVSGRWSGLVDQDGQWVLRYPLRTTSD